MGLVKLAALWPAKPGQNMAFSGKTDTPQDADEQQKQKDLLRQIASGEEVRLVVLNNDQKGNFKAPVLRILMDDGQDAPPQRQNTGYQQQGGGYASGGYGQPPQPPPPQPSGGDGWDSPSGPPAGGYGDSNPW